MDFDLRHKFRFSSIPAANVLVTHCHAHALTLPTSFPSFPMETSEIVHRKIDTYTAAALVSAKALM